MRTSSSLLLYAVSLISVAQAISPLSVIGSKFFTDDGNQFFLKGIAYQLVEDDPLVDTEQCQRDASLMQQLGANAIRVYHVNETADHSGCMNAFANVGIYVFPDLDSFHTYIRLADGPSWTQEKSDSFRAVMDNFQQYDNTGGFFVGNEVLNSKADSGSAPYLLAAKVDLSAYGKAKGYRNIPIGYSATDTSDLRPMLQDYLVCRPNVTERLDFYSLNSYEWCGQSTFQTSGYVALQNAAENYPVPIFFSEDGCNTQGARDFSDQAAIFGDEMAGTWSGAIIYEWIQEANHYGLITYGPQQDASVNEGSSIVQGFVRQGSPTPVQPDFDNLKSAWAAAKPSGVQSAAYEKAIVTSVPSCPASSGGWTVDPSAALPTIGQAAASGTATSETAASGTTSAAGASSTASSAGVGRSASMPMPSIRINEYVILHTFMALAGTSLAAIFLL